MDIGNPEPRRKRPDVRESSKIGAARVGKTDIVLTKTHLSRGYRWNSCRRTVHAGNGSGGGRSPPISRRMSAKSCLGIVTSVMWRAVGDCYGSIVLKKSAVVRGSLRPDLARSTLAGFERCFMPVWVALVGSVLPAS